MGEDDRSTKEKNFEFWILLNWKTGDFKTYKLEPNEKKVGPYNIPIKVDLDVVVPEKPDVEAKGKIELGEDKVNEMMIEAM